MVNTRQSPKKTENPFTQNLSTTSRDPLIRTPRFLRSTIQVDAEEPTSSTTDSERSSPTTRLSKPFEYSNMPPKRTPVSKIQKTAASPSSQLSDLHEHPQYQLMRDELEARLRAEIIQEFEAVKEREARNRPLLQQGASPSHTIPSIERESTNLESSAPPLGRNVSFASAPPVADNRFSTPVSSIASTRPDKIPLLSAKLNTGVEPDISPELWRKNIEVRFQQYNYAFNSELIRMAYVMDNVEGTARTFLEPYWLRDLAATAEELIDLVVNFLSDPSKAEKANDKYQELAMTKHEEFRTFYHQFRSLASQAQICDEKTLRIDLRRKVPLRLRSFAANDYRKTTSLQDYVDSLTHFDQEFRSQEVTTGKSFGAYRDPPAVRYSKSQGKKNNQEEHPIKQSSSNRNTDRLQPDTPPSQLFIPSRSGHPKGNNPDNHRIRQDSEKPNVKFERRDTPRINELNPIDHTDDEASEDDEPQPSRAKDDA